MPDHLMGLFKDTFGTYVEKSTFKEWIREHLSPTSPCGENVGEDFPQASPEPGKTNKDRKFSPLEMGKNGEEISPMGKNGEEMRKKH